MEKAKSYILSQRLQYLGLGAVVGFILALNESPLNHYLVFGFVLLTIVLSYLIKRR